MKTDAVMCIAFTRHKPSVTPLWSTSVSICGVMLMNPRRAGTSNQRCSVSDFNLRFKDQISRDASCFLRRNNRLSLGGELRYWRADRFVEPECLDGAVQFAQRIKTLGGAGAGI